MAVGFTIWNVQKNSNTREEDGDYESERGGWVKSAAVLIVTTRCHQI